MATIRKKLSSYAITISTFRKRPIFQQTALAELFIATLFRYRDAGKFHLHAFVVMPDHVHVLITPALDQSTARCIQLIKGGGFSHAARPLFSQDIWHPGHYEHRIRDADDMRAQTLYIAHNPTRRQLQPYPHVHTAALYKARLDLPTAASAPSPLPAASAQTGHRQSPHSAPAS